ncbi:sn-glycerol-3-phosphate ABC transporter ATP-binding protein UgpC [Stappia sp. F7233]|uniref:sn-glycerol-3-phosphate ABC transporter ATP-binding protein UgpC n=1 Tax=Stappia albiluteola TaxID=2758565 RepID=A0A839A925_9HYPH|nr:sn-glycerol-3-phosphate ABC transporter ATP-binding protein UgpC [Stappia albiluteola]MBA5776033.1 sn-glycerol-3-phosphate ABC transporter ATP-binding protein UgpC [Stappia albiluteola]
MAGVELFGVSKSFGATRVIHNVDLTIEDGEFVVFVGPSGCGKSTLLRMIAGLEDVTSGDLLIGGQRMNHVEAARRGIAMVFQSYALYPHMTVAENMSFGLRMTGVPKAEIEAKVSSAAATLQLEELLARKPAQLSGGQRQRVAIGRAIVRDPGVFLFDEPLSNLDAELRVQMRVEIARLHRGLANTMIYVTHDQTEAMTLADKIVVLRAGRVEQVGSPLSLYEDPANEFVAGFIGSPKMNFLAARAGGNGRGKDVTLAGVESSFELPLESSLSAGTDVRIGIRPEHFCEAGDADVRLTATIEVVEHLGGTSYVHGRLANGEALVIERRGYDMHRVGEAIETGFHLRDVRAFGGNGMRIR